MKLLASGFLLLLVLTGCTVSFSPQPQADLPKPTAGTASQQAEAAGAARHYLALIDNKEYDKTWDQAGPALRSTTSKVMWTSVLKAGSRALGSPAKREIEGFGFTTKVDAAVPAGDYVMVQFKSRSGNTTLTEKVVMQKEQGSWKIIGYFANKRAEFGEST